MAKGKNRLNIDKLYQAAENAEKALPRLVDKVIVDIEEGDYSLKERVSAMRLLLSIVSAKPRMEDDLGLRGQENRSESPVMVVLADTVTLPAFRRLPRKERRELVLKALGGEMPELPVTQIEAEYRDSESLEASPPLAGTEIT